MKEAPTTELETGTSDSAKFDSWALKKIRKLGWGAAVLAFIIGYPMWLVPYNIWEAGIAFTCVALGSIFLLNCYLASKSKKYDLFFAALLAVAAPFIFIFCAFVFFFSGPPS